MEITERMCAAALEAYWGPRPYVPYKRRQKWTDKEMEGMHDAIKAALHAAGSDPMRCAECTCAYGGTDCNWIARPRDAVGSPTGDK
jgi:hypothetical protein